MNNTEKTIGFIMLRHVNNELTNKYWIHCYKCIRNFYPENKIIIIDDNSDYKYITTEILYKTVIIQSEYPGRGELLPYYYYLQNNLFDIAVIIHDSVFINKYIDFNVEKYKLIWDFDSKCASQEEDQLKLLNLFNDKNLIDFYNNKKLWSGCFGGMTIINYDFLYNINKKYDFSILLPHILTRYNHCSFERVIACLLQIEEKTECLLGNIHKYCKWGIKFDEREKHKKLPLIKVWTGR
jgi:hypothetical protein